MIDGVVMQVAADVSTAAHDVAIGPVHFDYPWGDDASGELFAVAFYKALLTFIKEWAGVESMRAVHDDD